MYLKILSYHLILKNDITGYTIIKFLPSLLKYYFTIFWFSLVVFVAKHDVIVTIIFLIMSFPVTDKIISVSNYFNFQKTHNTDISYYYLSYPTFEAIFLLDL